MWHTVRDFYRFRVPYLAEFFEDVALRLPLPAGARHIDLACGTGNLLCGFAPYVDGSTGIDSDPELLGEARRRLAEIGKTATLIVSPVDQAPRDIAPVDLITIGLSYWYMHTPPALERIDRWLRPGGAVIICSPSEPNIGQAEWFNLYSAIRVRWGRRKDLYDQQYLTPAEFFSATDFEQSDVVRTFGEAPVDVEHLIKRLQSYPGNTREALGADAERMFDEVRAAMEPYFRGGTLMERQCTTGYVFRRRRDRASAA
jgi:ubiquinone/menaquinone biosynthesis C-methylase UbiE